MAVLEIRLLGELTVTLAGAGVALPASRRARALLAWLALRPGPHSRSQLAALLWPDVLSASARASLRSALWALRGALGPAAEAFLLADRDSVELRGDGLLVDVREFARLAGDGRPEDAVRLHRGDLLSEFDADWVLDAREEHRDLLAAALAALASRAGDEPAALGWARQRAALRPLDEHAGRDLIRLLAAGGDTAGALAAYVRLAERLRAELGIAPAPETRRLAAKLRESCPAHDTGVTPAAGPPGGAAASTGGTAARLVGRDGEVRRLRRQWEAARRGTGTAVVICGDGGMGKTMLARDVMGAAEADGALSASGMAGGLGGGAPLGVWSELLGDLAAHAGSALGSAQGTATEPSLDRIRFFESAVALLSRAARERPLALALEDLHLADSSSLELIAYAGRRMARLPVLLVLTRRRLPPRPELDAVLGALRARGTLAAEIDLGPLPDSALGEIVRSAGDLTAQRRDRIVQLAAGSPLLAAETARSAADDPTGDPAAGLSGATRQAIGRLGGQARLFVELASVAGRDLGRAEVASLPLLASPSRAATEALGSGLLAVRGGLTGFRHEMLREAIYNDLPDPARVRLHEALASWLRDLAAPARGQARRAAEIAGHLRLAGRDDLAAASLVRAAAAARTIAALPEAAAYLEEAVSLEARGLGTPDPELLTELAEVHAWRGMMTESDGAFGRALELIAPDDNDAQIGAWVRRGRWLRGGVCHPRESLRSYRAALDFLDREPDADALIRAEALAGMAWAQAVAGDPGTVGGLLAEAAALTDPAAPGMPDMLRHDLDVARAHALLRAGRFTDSYAPLTAAATAAGRAGRPDLAYSCLANAASAAACASDLPRALEFADRCLPLVVPNGLLRLCVYVHSARAALLWRLGRLAEADAACDQAGTAAERIGLAELEGLVHHDRGLLAAASADPAKAAAELGLALDLRAPVSRPLARLLRADALVRAGREDDAERELRAAALEPVSPANLPDTLVPRMSHVQGLIAFRRGDLPLAARRLREAAAAWERRAKLGAGAGAGEGYAAALIDLGRPPISTLVEPDRELAVIARDLAAALAGRNDADLRG
jgi:DNA-binding SARP family transcriptional activator/tetratricopeptide (TPR) repeat protein